MFNFESGIYWCVNFKMQGCFRITQILVIYQNSVYPFTCYAKVPQGFPLKEVRETLPERDGDEIHLGVWSG